jgi:predicted polyphosphate/ATP-dependent NAD kinase
VTPGDARPRRVGLVVNPVAGLGGPVGLKGTDGAAVQAQARERGAVPHAGERAARAVARLARALPGVVLVTVPGAMGADAASAAGVPAEVLPLPLAGETTADDTRAAGRALAGAGIELLLFAGGDGTARDVLDAVDHSLPVLGVPAGVKMHSAAFAATPESAGDAAAAFLGGTARATRDAEVVDIDEEAVREGVITTRLYGVLPVPADRTRLLATKASAPADDERDLDAVCARLADAMDPRRLYVLGPGTTTRRIMRRLGLEKTLLGADVVRGGRLVAADVGEAELLALLEVEPATLVVGVTGGQGALFGRGNQQLSPAVLRRIGPENIVVIAGLRKLLALDPPVLHVDTGDPALDADLTGYRRVHVAPNRTLVQKVAA